MTYYRLQRESICQLWVLNRGGLNFWGVRRGEGGGGGGGRDDEQNGAL